MQETKELSLQEKMDKLDRSCASLGLEHLGQQHQQRLAGSSSSAADAQLLERWQLMPPGCRQLDHRSPLVPCKSPLEGPLHGLAAKKGLTLSKFDRKDLLALCQSSGSEVGLVVDLEGTGRFYPGFQPEDGVEYARFQVPEGEVPDASLLHTVLRAIDSFDRRQSAVVKEGHQKKAVAIHCSDGVGRTGYFTIAHLLLRSQEEHFSLDEAVRCFELARGCRFDDRQLLDGLEMLAEQQKDI